MEATSESEVNSYDLSPTLKEIFRHDYDSYFSDRMCRCGVQAHTMASKMKEGNYFAWHDGVFPLRCVKLINKLRDKQGGLQYYDFFIEQQHLEISNYQKFLKLSVGFNDVPLWSASSHDDLKNEG
ncbi:hypothetical protein ACFE04_001749 [Oxalis oulophora]